MFLETVLTSVLIISLCLLLFYFKHSYNYWRRRGVPQITPSFPFGNMASVILLQQNMGDKITQIYNYSKEKGHKYVGLYFFSRKTFLAIDPNIIKNILTKDFNYFDDRGIYYDEINDPLSAHLFSLSGVKWKSLRAKFTPTFTPGKLKYMFNIFLICGNQMSEILAKMAGEGTPVEIKDIMARFTTDVIGSSAFGLDCNTMKDPNTKFRQMGKRAFTQTIGDAFKVAVIRSFPHVAKMLSLGIFSSSVTNFFLNVVKDTIEYREKNNVVRKDFLQLLIQLKQNGEVEEDDFAQEKNSSAITSTLTLNEAAAQAFIFFLAGFETTATTMSFAIFEMATDLSLQEKAREEVRRVLNKFGNELTYEAVMEMPYLDKIVCETLRKHPPAPVYLRKCTRDYLIPGTDVTIEKDLSVLIPALPLQRDEEYFESPETFDPERFSEENKHKIRDYTYIPFGEGPRVCIGKRFALIQIKVGLISILRNFEFSLNIKTNLPLEMEPKGIITTPKDGIWLNLQNINSRKLSNWE